MARRLCWHDLLSLLSPTMISREKRQAVDDDVTILFKEKEDIFSTGECANPRCDHWHLLFVWFRDPLTFADVLEKANQCGYSNDITMCQTSVLPFATTWHRYSTLPGLFVSGTWLGESDMRLLCRGDVWRAGLLLLLASCATPRDSRRPASVLRSDFSRIVCDSPSPTAAGIL